MYLDFYALLPVDMIKILFCSYIISDEYHMDIKFLKGDLIDINFNHILILLHQTKIHFKNRNKTSRFR